MNLIYLDYNCFQLGFDVLQQIRIQMEALASEWIFEQAQMGRLTLAWSFMHDDENHLCPFLDRQIEALRLSELCLIKIAPETEIYNRAKEFHQTANLSPKDAIHVSCAVFINADYFITCDDRLLKQTNRLNLHTEAINPTNYLMKLQIT
jgi:hypothetical protein